MTAPQPRPGSLPAPDPMGTPDAPDDGPGAVCCGSVVDLLRDPYNAPVDVGLVALMVRSLTRNPTGPAALAWAVYVFRATRQLDEPDAARRQTAATVLSQLMRDRGRPDVPVWRDDSDRLSGPARLTEARFAVVRALHERGLCEPALSEARAALHEWTDRGRPGIGGVFLLSTVRVLDLCGRVDEARALLDDHAPLAVSRLQPVVAVLAEQLLGNINAIVQHRRVCTFDPGPAAWPHRREYGEVRRMFLDRLADDRGPAAPLWPPALTRNARRRPARGRLTPNQPPVRAGPSEQHRRSPPGPASNSRRPGPPP